MCVLRVLAVLAISIVVVHATATHSNENDNNYIIGGQNGAVAQFPFKVSLRTFQHRHFCGGVIVNARWFMTSAHCVANRVRSPRTFLIVANPVGPQRGAIYTTTRIVLHPKFEPRNRQNDIAMMQAVVPIRWKAGFVVPVRLPTSDLPDTARATLIVTGLGQKRVSHHHVIIIKNNLSKINKLFVLL